MFEREKRTVDLHNTHWQVLILRCNVDLVFIVQGICLHFWHHPTFDEIEDYRGKIMLHLLADDGHRLKTYDPSKSSLRTWLTRVAEHLISDELKHRRGWDSLDDVSLELLLEPPRQELQIITQERRALVEQVVNKLSAHQQRLYRLVCEGLSAPEIAKRLNIKTASVHRRKHELIMKIQAGLRNGGGKSRARMSGQKSNPEQKK